MKDEPVITWDTFGKEITDELSPDGGIQRLIGLRARTLIGLRTSSDSDLCRAMNVIETRSLIGFELWELSMDDSSPDWDYLPDLTFCELGTLSEARSSERDLELYGIRNFTTSEYQMNFHWNSGSPLYGLDPRSRVTD